MREEWCYIFRNLNGKEKNNNMNIPILIINYNSLVISNLHIIFLINLCIKIEITKYTTINKKALMEIGIIYSHNLHNKRNCKNSHA